ncbi:hypothetical protein WJX72_008340 [[Myrmecia] bisecta]|uniref:Chlorophyllase n=1 Tax=[Myrmecia] bisecta TaxID=41462 RepID=A0AAW1Q4P8_9CHLO
MQVAGSTSPDFTQKGPFKPHKAVQGTRFRATCGQAPGCDQAVNLSLTVTVPSSAPEQPHGSFPIVFLFNGFKMRASFYKQYAEHLSSWGCSVLQYDHKFWHTPADASEVQFLDQLIDWVAQQNDTPNTPLSGLVDISKIAVAGHSRGGKLAALHLAGNPRVKTAFLIDPVDSTTYVPPSPQNPSAVQALAGLGKRAGMVAAGITCSCNPAGSNYQKFFGVLGSGSWLAVILQASHQEFLNAPLLNWVFNHVICPPAGSSSHQVTMALTSAPLLRHISGLRLVLRPWPSGWQ